MRIERFFAAAAAPLLTFAAITLSGCSGAASDTASTGAASAETSDDDNTVEAPSNFAQVNDTLYRGGHPDHGNLVYLQSIGVKTIVDLEIADLIEATPSEIADEVADATAMGFTVIREPLSAFQPFVSDTEMNRTIDELSDPANGTVYVHCRHGQDRTGMVVGLERVLVEGWTQSDAYDEMLAHGFHTYFLGLKDYFFDKTAGH